MNIFFSIRFIQWLGNPYQVLQHILILMDICSIQYVKTIFDITRRCAFLKAGLYILSQVEAGVCCPLSMTYSGYPVLHRYLHCTSKKLSDSFPLDKLLSRKYDQRALPANTKSGLTIGLIEFPLLSPIEYRALLFRNGFNRKTRR